MVHACELRARAAIEGLQHLDNHPEPLRNAKVAPAKSCPAASALVAQVEGLGSMKLSTPLGTSECHASCTAAFVLAFCAGFPFVVSEFSATCVCMHELDTISVQSLMALNAMEDSLGLACERA